MPLLSFSCLFSIFRPISLSIRKPFTMECSNFLFSMGGSVAVHVAARREIRNLHGLVVIDVVEVCNSYSLCSILRFCITILIIAGFGHISFLNREQQWLRWFICRRSYPIGHSISLALKKQYVNFILHCFCSPFW